MSPGRDPDLKRAQAQLEAGDTTLLSGGGPADANITLRDRNDSGQIKGGVVVVDKR